MPSHVRVDAFRRRQACCGLAQQPEPMAGQEKAEARTVEKPDLLILGLDRQALEIGLAIATLGGKVVVARTAETAVTQAIRDGEMLARLVSAGDSIAFEARRLAILEDIRRQRSTERLRAARIQVMMGPARFLGRRRILIGEAPFEPRRVLLASGRRATAPPEALHALFEQGKVPRRLILRGASMEALDLAGLLMRLGAEVTLLGESPAAPDFDPDGVRLLLDRLERQGLVRLPAMPAARPADLPLWEIGSPLPALDGLDLDKAGIRLGDGRLVLRNGFETTNARVFALGRAAEPDQPADPGAVAHLIGRMFFRRSGNFAPQPRLRLLGGEGGLAETGLTEREALALGAVQIARAAFSDADPSDLSGGFVKLLGDGKGRLRGASLYGPGSAERLPVLALALGQGLTLTEIARLPFPAGSASDAIRLAAASPARGLLRSAGIQRAFRFFRFLG
ncbi:MAG: NAD(P)/FAD-dependent oxidoreductase [Methylobacterium sp.]|nr:NAD(P)/FAD-dependent oxidoreductase [Methylobacterium sp.]MCA3607194.1 NAD(P)/FAD-dependent oxidoreductase [Methylobacterium sp.]MCA3610743.1 NAD(P)/FAD-dependent oxidoreductase [Methylobacterium sp.]MCA3619379.1 NAD(P)/FAD-dependent oxidoreductase [Methylobacterium sp.]MCA3622531.1 NAD(P)/FAD-dependent oxidoreductase [Methylobacterium sp.]